MRLANEDVTRRLSREIHYKLKSIRVYWLRLGRASLGRGSKGFEDESERVVIGAMNDEILSSLIVKYLGKIAFEKRSFNLMDF